MQFSAMSAQKAQSRVISGCSNYSCLQHSSPIVWMVGNWQVFLIKPLPLFTAAHNQARVPLEPTGVWGRLWIVFSCGRSRPRTRRRRPGQRWCECSAPPRAASGWVPLPKRTRGDAGRGHPPIPPQGQRPRATAGILPALRTAQHLF